MSLIETMAEAIKQFEGWFPGSRSFRNNNPGNLRWITGLPGQTGLDDTGHIIFATYQDGWNALVRQIRLAVDGLSHVYSPNNTLYEFFSKYAEANSVPYAEHVANALQVSPSATLAEIFGGGGTNTLPDPQTPPSLLLIAILGGLMLYLIFQKQPIYQRS